MKSLNNVQIYAKTQFLFTSKHQKKQKFFLRPKFIFKSRFIYPQLIILFTLLKMTKKILILLTVICLSFSILDEQDRYCLVNSLAVGGDNGKIMDWTCKYCNSSYEPTPLDNTPKNIRIVQGYASEWLKKKFTQDFKAIITLYDNFIILAFKFTDNIPKLFVDLNAKPTRVTVYCDHCKAHEGFFELWEHNKDKVFQSLREIYKIKNVKKLYITGISLGGALAVMSYFDIKNKFPQFTDIQVTTFGAPRVGNKKFANHFDQLTNNSSKRFVVKKDPIPSLPPKLLGAYQHTGVQFLCDVKNQDCKYMGHVSTDFSNQISNDQTFLKTLNNPSMFNFNLCKSEKHSHNFLRKRVFQHKLQNHENQLSQNHQFQKHDSVINHICDYPKLLFFAPKSTNDNLNNTDKATISDNKIIFGQQYRKMLVHSLGVFKSETQITNWSFPYSDKCDPPSNITIFQHNQTGFKAMITTYLSQNNNKYMILTFRGSTNNPQNWKTNYDKKFTNYSNCNQTQCYVHEGFYKLWKTASIQIINRLKKNQEQNNISKLYLTGISLGGALAQICVLDIFHQITFKTISVITFGSPRVGSKNWGNQYNQKMINMPKTQRFTLQKDPVPVVPAWPEYPPQKYFQIGVQDKCHLDLYKKNCVSQKQGDNNEIILYPLELQKQIKKIMKKIKQKCGERVEIYCGPPNSNYPQCIKVQSELKDYDFNVHACNYTQLFKPDVSY